MSEEKPAVAGDGPAPEPSESSVEPAHDALAVDEAFAPTLDPEVLTFGETKPQALVCGWCNQPLPGPDLERGPPRRAAPRARRPAGPPVPASPAGWSFSLSRCISSSMPSQPPGALPPGAPRRRDQ